MKVEHLDAAVKEAKRFILLTQWLKKDKDNRRFESGAAVAATKRASLDLTKALARLRRDA